MSYNAKNYTEQGGDVTHFDGKVVFGQSAEIEGLAADPLQTASAETLGGVKIGAGLSIDDNGVLSADGITPAEVVAESEATDVAGVNTVLNALIGALQDAGLMATASEE